MKSLWLENIKVNDIKKLNKNIKTDILIIGGGITGITTAYELINKNLKITLVDQNLTGHGISSKTTGKLNYLQETIYTDLLNTYNLNTAKLYLKSQRDAIKEVEKIINYNNIDCDFDWVESFVFTDKNEDISKLKKEKRILEKLGVKVYEHDNININFECLYAISVKDTAIFHPIKYILKLREICKNNNIDIYENTKIINLEKKTNYYVAHTNKFKIEAKKIVIATHYPFFILPFFMPIKTYIEKSYIIADNINDYYKTTYITASNPCKSIRYHKDNKNNYMIYLSNSHKICNNINEKKNFDKTIKEANKLNLKDTYIWSNDDLITYDKMPFIGKINNDDNLLIATGYNTWGMTNGTIAGIILSDILLGKNNIYEKIFNPNRHTITKLTKYPINLMNNMIGFYRTKFNKQKTWYPNNIIFTKINGKQVGIYKDNNDISHIVYNKCPHMGCSLIFNEIEKTWDCPCHASRFDIDGKCIKGPSKYNITFKNND